LQPFLFYHFTIKVLDSIIELNKIISIKMIENKKERGRPFKMQTWITELKNVLEERNIIYLTDEDLIFLVNKRLPKESQISKSTFEKWKAGKFAPDDETGKEFIDLIHLALINEKNTIGYKLENDTSGQWTRYAWILERKFSEWNLKHISENINKNEQATIIQITAGNEEQKKMIENLINYSPDFVEIKPNQISANDNDKEDEFDF
jgi:hypothetical protein